MKMTLYATITPSASNKLWDPCFMVDFMQQTNIKYVVPRKIWCLFTFMIVFSLCELSFLLFASVNTRYVNMFMQASDRLNLFYFNFQYICVIEKQREREERDRNTDVFSCLLGELVYFSWRIPLDDGVINDLRENPAHRYSFVCNAMLHICNTQDTDRWVQATVMSWQNKYGYISV